MQFCSLVNAESKAKNRRKLMKKIGKKQLLSSKDIYRSKTLTKLQTLAEMVEVEVQPVDNPWKASLCDPLEHCYICKAKFVVSCSAGLYHCLCEGCAELSLRMRGLRGDLAGKAGVLTGGRARIGYEILLSLLESGAKVYVTTRFPFCLAQKLTK